MSANRLPVVVASILAILAGVLLYGSLAAKEREMREGWDPLPILVASVDSPDGLEMELARMARSEMPERFVSPSMVRPEHAQTLVGQRLVVPLRAGDPILWSHFERAGEGDKLAAKVMKKTRAVTVSVTETSSVGGWILPNDHVDVLATFRDPQSQEMVTSTLLRNVIVLATGKTSAADAAIRQMGRGYADVSLLVLPEEAELLVLAQQMGSLTLVLRHPEEADSDEDRGRATAGTLLTGERSRALQKIRSEAVQVIRGPRGIAQRSSPRRRGGGCARLRGGSR